MSERSDPRENKPFFIGWEAKHATPISAFLKKISIFLVLVSVGTSGIVTAMQKTVTSGIFDFGNVRGFSGILVNSPVPMLIADSGSVGQRVFYLVAPFKNGFPADTAAEHHLYHVTLKGTLIGDELDSMIEVVTGSASSTGSQTTPVRESTAVNATIRGEIVDSKCHLGVMNPGRFKPHRACAIQRIKGGIPPHDHRSNRRGNAGAFPYGRHGWLCYQWRRSPIRGWACRGVRSIEGDRRTQGALCRSREHYAALLDCPLEVLTG